MIIMNSSRRAWPVAALASVVAGLAALGAACSGGAPREHRDGVGAVSAAVVDQSPIQGPFEPTIAVNPKNPVNIAIAAGGTLRVSIDGGQTFTAPVGPKLPANVGASGDPSLAFDSNGHLFWGLLGSRIPGSACPPSIGVCGSWDVYVQQVDGALGTTIGSAANLSTIGVLPSGISDKGWIAADRFPGSPCLNDLYVAFLDVPEGIMRFSRSTDGGAHWSTTLAVLSDTPSDDPVDAAHVAVGADGAVYVA
jgi:hypothetical protein